MSFAAAICSIVSVGMLPTSGYFSLVPLEKRCQNLRVRTLVPSLRAKLLVVSWGLLSLMRRASDARHIVGKGVVGVVPRQGEISHWLATFLRRGIKAAETA